MKWTINSRDSVIADVILLMSIHHYMLTIAGEKPAITIRNWRTKSVALECNIAVPVRNAVYLLPDRTIADVTPTLIWCFTCSSFSDGEFLRTRDEYKTLIKNCASELPWPYHYHVCDTDSKVERFTEHINRCLNQLKFRTHQPRCLGCGSSEIEFITASEKQDFEDPKGRIVHWVDWVLSSEIDKRLFVYNHDGALIVEISAICPDSNRLIFDEYPPENLIKLVNAKLQNAE